MRILNFESLAVAAVSSSNDAARVIVVTWAAALVLATALVWFVRKKRLRAPVFRQSARAAINVAGTGVPSTDVIKGWTKERLDEAVRAFAEFDGYKVDVADLGPAMLALQRRQDQSPRVLVRCVPGSASAVSLTEVEEVHRLIREKNIRTAWMVSPGTFGSKVRGFARDNPAVVLVDANGIQAFLQVLPAPVLANFSR